jgi:hypothetical protein
MTSALPSVRTFPYPNAVERAASRASERQRATSALSGQSPTAIAKRASTAADNVGGTLARLGGAGRANRDQSRQGARLAHWRSVACNQTQPDFRPPGTPGGLSLSWRKSPRSPPRWHRKFRPSGIVCQNPRRLGRDGAAAAAREVEGSDALSQSEPSPPSPRLWITMDAAIRRS